jgi:hypothetical protein
MLRNKINGWWMIRRPQLLDLLEHMVERQQVEKRQVRKRNGTFEGYRWVREICPG